MACFASAYIIICWCVEGSPRVATFHRLNALDSLEDWFKTPKATACQYYFFGFHTGLCIKFRGLGCCRYGCSMAAVLSRRSPGWAIAMLRRASNRIPSIDLLLTVLLIPGWGCAPPRTFAAKWSNRSAEGRIPPAPPPYGLSGRTEAKKAKG